VADKLKNSAAAENQVRVVKLTGADHRFRNHEKELEEAITKWLGEQLSQ
jgi:alpha/beta superfamily hydrolase